MFYNLIPDNDITRERLTDGRMVQYDVIVDSNPRGAAMTCCDSKMLVRFDSKGKVERLIPLDNGPGTSQILVALGREFHAAFEVGFEDSYYALAGEAA